MLKWSEMRSLKDTILAVWREYRPLYWRWFIQALLDEDGLPLRWRERYIPGSSDGDFSDHYADCETAVASADALNPEPARRDVGSHERPKLAPFEGTHDRKGARIQAAS